MVRDARAVRRHRRGLSADASSWSGTIMLGTGWALIDARIGNSRPHSHLAHQISLAVERDLEIGGDEPMTLPVGQAVAIASHVHHRLGPEGALVRSFYLDPLFRADARLAARSAPVLLAPAAAAGLGEIASAADASAGRPTISTNRRQARSTRVCPPRSRFPTICRRRGRWPTSPAFRPRACAKSSAGTLACLRPNCCNGSSSSAPCGRWRPAEASPTPQRRAALPTSRISRGAAVNGSA